MFWDTHPHIFMDPPNQKYLQLVQRNMALKTMIHFFRFCGVFVSGARKYIVIMFWGAHPRPQSKETPFQLRTLSFYSPQGSVQEPYT